MTWFSDRLAELSGRPAPSMLHLGCRDGVWLKQVNAAGVQAFGVEPCATLRDAARAACPDAYVSGTIEEIPPHRFDLIVIGAGAAPLEPMLHELAAKDAFGPETGIVVLDRPSEEAVRVLDALRFRAPTVVDDADGLRVEARGSDFALFMQERFVPGTWSELAAYEHLPRYAYARAMAEGRRVLDFGCGSGYGAAALAGVAASVTGLDISEDALAFARGRHHAPGLVFIHDDEFGASLPDASFDLIVCFEVIEHLDEAAQARLLPALRRLLAPAGNLLISTPNPHTTALYGANPYHLRELTEREFAELLQQHFPTVALVEQSIEVAIFLQPVGRPARFELRDDVDSLAGPGLPAIFIAVCGLEATAQAPLPAVVYPDRARDYVGQRIQALRRRDRQLIERYALLQARSELGRVRAALETAANERQEAVAAAEMLSADRRRLEGELAAQQRELAAVLEDRALLQATYDASTADAGLTRAALDLTRNELAAVLADRTLLQATHAQTVSEAARATAALEALQADRTRMQAACERAALDARQAHDAHASALAELAATRTRHEQLHSEHHRLRAEHDRMFSAHAAECARADSIMETQRAALAVAEAERERLHAELAHAAADASRLHGLLNAETGRASALDLELKLRSERLAAIETSTSWRVARRAVPLLRLARPALRPVARIAWRIVRGRRLPAAVQPAPATEVVEPADTLVLPPEPPAPSPVLQPARDLLREVALDPVWDDSRGAYVLQPDTGFSPPAGQGGLIAPYVVRLLTPVDLGAIRPLILHIIPNVHVGGSTQLIIDLVQHLSSGYRHEILTSSLWPGGAHDGLVVHHVPAASAEAMAGVIATVRPDLMHVHYWGLTDDPWYYAALEAMTRHPAPSIQNINTPIAPLVHPLFKRYVFVSEYVRQTFGAAVPGMQAVVVHPGIDLGRFGAWTPAADRDNAIGMVYRLEDDKLNEDAIDVFIEIVRRRPRTKAYIIGGGRFLLPYLERTEQAGVRENFRFTGYVPYATLPGWYDRFAVFVAPIWKESFGQVAPFAMSKRAVVAGFAVGALPEILGGRETLGEGVDDTAAIVTALLDDPGRMREIGLRNQARARSLFDVGHMAERYNAVYASALAG